MDKNNMDWTDPKIGIKKMLEKKGITLSRLANQEKQAKLSQVMLVCLRKANELITDAGLETHSTASAIIATKLYEDFKYKS